VPIFRKYEANSELFNENFRKSGAVIPLLRPIHPKSDRLLVASRTGGRWCQQVGNHHPIADLQIVTA
jgi:hypothetical protein